MENNLIVEIDRINELMGVPVLEQRGFEFHFNNTFGTAKGAQKYYDDMEPVFGFLEEYKHEILGVAAIGAFFIPVIGPALSLGLELADAALYYAEGDKEMAGVSLFFSVIPFGELVNRIPAVKSASKEAYKNVIKKIVRTGSGASGIKYTKAEQDILRGIFKDKKLIIALGKHYLIKTALKGTLLTLKNKSPRKFIDAVIELQVILNRVYPKTYPIVAGGIWIGAGIHEIIKIEYDKAIQIAKNGSALVDVGGNKTTEITLKDIYQSTIDTVDNITHPNKLYNSNLMEEFLKKHN